VYAARGTDVRMTMVDGAVLVRDFQLTQQDAGEIVSKARDAAAQLEASLTDSTH
jgi:hypothetical protein